jgi:large-conductance mechanosensitive channel
MPLPLAILLGIALGILIAQFNLMILVCVIICLPGYYAIRNYIDQRKNEGPWSIRWDLFLQMALIELVVFGVIIVFILAGNDTMIMIIGLIVYIVLNALGWGLRKNSDHAAK